MSWEKELLFVSYIILAGFLGSLIGLERERHVGLAGIRTHAAVAVGSCLFGLISFHVLGLADPSRIAAQIVSGVGFLGAGVILRDRGRVRGLTTAATLWATASVGLAIANSMFILGIATSVILIGLLSLHRLPGWLTTKYNRHPLFDEENGD
ncbi:MAG: MgtC/SapB family protein [Simkaniaceae bacterium]|nr:MgtC/SapB family protein [Simkaniaceae bacterium]